MRTAKGRIGLIPFFIPERKSKTVVHIVVVPNGKSSKVLIPLFWVAKPERKELLTELRERTGLEV